MKLVELKDTYTRRLFKNSEDCWYEQLVHRATNEIIWHKLVLSKFKNLHWTVVTDPIELTELNKSFEVKK